MNFLLVQGHTGTANPCVLLRVLCMMPLVLKYTEPTLFLSGTFYFEGAEMMELYNSLGAL